MDVNSVLLASNKVQWRLFKHFWFHVLILVIM